MKKLFFYIFLVFLVSTRTFSQDFVNGLDDIPLYSGMSGVDDTFVIFDKVDGRYVYSEIEGQATLKKVKNFYEIILPNLGWSVAKKNFYQRGQETLEIKFETEKNITKVIFSIFPKK
jgi:hypothetical protein